MIFTSPAPQRHNLEQSSLFAEIFQEKPRTLQEQRLGGVRGRKERKAGTLWSVVSLVAAAQTLPSFLLLLGSQLDTRRLAPALPSGGGPAWQGGWRTVILMPSPAPTPEPPGGEALFLCQKHRNRWSTHCPSLMMNPFLPLKASLCSSIVIYSPKEH